MGQNDSTRRGPQVLVHVSMHQGSSFVYWAQLSQFFGVPPFVATHGVAPKGDPLVFLGVLGK